MVTEPTTGTESTGSTQEWISAEDFRRFQSEADRKLAAANALADELSAKQAEYERQLAELTDRLDPADPEVKQARREAAQARAEAEAERRRVKQLTPTLQQSMIRAHVAELAPGDKARQRELASILATATTPDHMDQMAAALAAQLKGAPAAAPRAPKNEIDDARGIGKGGAVAITRELLAEKAQSGDTAWYNAHKAEIHALQQAGKL